MEASELHHIEILTEISCYIVFDCHSNRFKRIFFFCPEFRYRCASVLWSCQRQFLSLNSILFFNIQSHCKYSAQCWIFFSLNFIHFNCDFMFYFRFRCSALTGCQCSSLLHSPAIDCVFSSFSFYLPACWLDAIDWIAFPLVCSLSRNVPSHCHIHKHTHAKHTWNKRSSNEWQLGSWQVSNNAGVKLN